MLLAVKTDDSPLFLSRAAKIIGVSYSYWREAELLGRLRDLVAIEGVRDEACFELGMAMLIQGFDAENRREAEEAFTAARHWLQQSIQSRLHRPDASAYLLCLDVLITFSRGQGVEGATSLASSLSDRTSNVPSFFVYVAIC